MPIVVEQADASAKAPENCPYRPIGVLKTFFAARDREIVLEGPADTGKSRACLEKINTALIKYPKARAAIVRKTRKSLRTSAQETFEKFVVPQGLVRPWNDEEYRYQNKSKIFLLGMDDPNKVLSSEMDLIYVQEASELAEEDWEMLTTRVTGRGAVMPYTQLMADMNPTDPSFWLYQREEAGKVRFLHVTHQDNPTVSPERLAALQALTGYRRERLYLGLRVAAEGMYFEEWDPNVHLVAPFAVPEHWTKWVCVDYGFAVPFCALWIARHPTTRHLYVYRELYAKGVRDELQARSIVKANNGERQQLVVGDPSMFAERREVGLPSIASIYHREGVPIVPGSNNRKQGWSTLRRVLAHDVGPPRLYIMRGRAPNLVRLLPTMVRDPLDPEDVADAVNGVKVEDHPLDCLRYGLEAEGITGQGKRQGVFG